jgi:hypothetical protein
MDPKNYQMKVENPLSFEEWKGNKSPQFNDDLLKSMDRLHSIDYKKEYEEMLKNEYQEYLNDFNGNWLL